MVVGEGYETTEGPKRYIVIGKHVRKDVHIAFLFRGEDRLEEVEELQRALEDDDNYMLLDVKSFEISPSYLKGWEKLDGVKWKPTSRLLRIEDD